MSTCTTPTNATLDRQTIGTAVALRPRWTMALAYRHAVVLIVLLFSGCVVFDSRTYDPMTVEDMRQMRSDCLRAAWCRALEGTPLVAYGPQPLDYMRSGDPAHPMNCQTHTDIAAARAAELRLDVPEAGVGQTCKLSGTVPSSSNCPPEAVEPDGRCRHAVLGVMYRGEPWIVDNGAVRECNLVCRAAQLREFVPRPERSTGDGCAMVVAAIRTSHS
jgi:hypothetical protein